MMIEVTRRHSPLPPHQFLIFSSMRSFQNMYVYDCFCFTKSVLNAQVSLRKSYFYVQLANSYTKMKLVAADYTSRIKLKDPQAINPSLGILNIKGFWKESKFFFNVSTA